jgi:ABC-type polar amino acid transport system ATPase subunit
MKVTQIKIIDFHQFKDLTIDLTYPKGHEKAGQPLNKVCFIGQSGTGKTSLLELVPKFILNYNTPIILKSGESSIYDNVELKLVFGPQYEYETTIYFTKEPVRDINDTGNTHWIWKDAKQTNKKIAIEQAAGFFDNTWLKEKASKIIYFPANLNYDIEIGSENKFDNKPIIDFSTEKISSVWNLTLEKIQTYQEQELQIRQEISKTVEQASNNLEVIENALKKLKDWKKSEFNPIQDIADNCLDRLLKQFKLKVKTELDIKSKEDIGFIKIEDFHKNEIPHGLWSTGTKQVTLSAMPLYLLKPKNTIVLFDEPERSLYPDMQRFIVDYYSSLTDNCQFFYSTHSPIIASNFEPWEIVELKFNEEGKIYRELYYEGENHVDNYKWNPRFMRWDDILQRIFDMKDDGSMARKQKLDELAKYNVKYKKLQKEKKEETEEAKDILKKIELLSKELSVWN